MVGAALAADVLHQFLAGKIGQILLDDRGLEGLAGTEFLHQLGARAGDDDLHAPAFADGGEHGSDTRMARGHEERLALENRVRHERLGRQRLLHRDGDVEAGALALLALDPDVAAHHFRELAADGEAEAGAAEAARGRGVDLRERLEEAVDLVRRNADAGVPDGKENEVVAGLVLGARDVDADVARRGEADGV